jgi:hypothetical protein
VEPASVIEHKAETARFNLQKEGTLMFVVLFAILLLAWLGGFLVFHVSSAMIHLLLLLAVISLIVHVVQRRPVA